MVWLRLEEQNFWKGCLARVVIKVSFLKLFWSLIDTFGTVSWKIGLKMAQILHQHNKGNLVIQQLTCGWVVEVRKFFHVVWATELNIRALSHILNFPSVFVILGKLRLNRTKFFRKCYRKDWNSYLSNLIQRVFADFFWNKFPDRRKLTFWKNCAFLLLLVFPWSNAWKYHRFDVAIQ